jgi:hypothetical protein
MKDKNIPAKKDYDNVNDAVATAGFIRRRIM